MGTAFWDHRFLRTFKWRNLFQLFSSKYLTTISTRASIKQRQNLIYQQDDAPPHYSHEQSVIKYKLPKLDRRRGGTVAWPDLNTMDYFVWGFLKNKVYATSVQSEQ